MAVSGWEAFMHGVFAIAVTLLVLDIRVPDSASIDSGSALVTALLDELPRYVAYVFGFLFVGTYWIQTHKVMSWMGGVDHRGLVLGLVYLMAIAAVPFVSGLLAEYIGLDDGRDQVGAVVFATYQLILSLLAIVNFRYIAKGGRLLKPSVQEAGLQSYLRVASIGPGTWLAVILAAVFVSAAVAMILTAVVLVIFLVIDVPVPLLERPQGATN
jgi:uncharacterized membrane protein